MRTIFFIFVYSFVSGIGYSTSLIFKTRNPLLYKEKFLWLRFIKWQTRKADLTDF